MTVRTGGTETSVYNKWTKIKQNKKIKRRGTLACRIEVRIWGRVTNIKGLLKMHIKTYHCQSFLKYTYNIKGT